MVSDLAETSVVVYASGFQPAVDAAIEQGRGKDLASFFERGVKATAQRFGVEDSPGIVVGSIVSTGEAFYRS